MSGDSRAGHQAAEAAARENYGRLVAVLAARSRNLDAAQDALADAFAEALASWPQTGIPDEPAAWLLAVSRRRLVDQVRKSATEHKHLAEIAAVLHQSDHAPSEPIADERLRLLLVCSHPAIDPAARAPLMLQTVFGLDAARIAGAFLVSPSTMSQRLVRAKQRIRDLGVPFEIPEPEHLPPRIGSVLDAIYAVYGTAWDDPAGADWARRGLGVEALRLAEVLAGLLPDEPEVLGLAALLHYCDARQPARRDAGGRYVPLSEQDPNRWRFDLIERAEQTLLRAARFKRPGRYQWEAAIQSAHVRRGTTGDVPWPEIVRFYDALLVIEQSLGALVSRAAALEQAAGPEIALAALQAIDPDRVAEYQPYWATIAHVLARLGHKDKAREAYARAIGQTVDPAVREFLVRQSGELHH